MTRMTPLKTLGISIIAIGLTSGAAFAGSDKDCKDKDHTTAMKTESNVSTAVLPASTEHKAKKEMKVYTFDEAMAKCQEYGATDLQACIDKKTGAAVKPKS